jgi:hypothetical protein
MHIFDIIEIWFHSMTVFLDAANVVARFDRSREDHKNSFCNLNIRHNDREVDLLIWEAGQAELVIGEVGGPVNQRHFDDVKNKAELLAVLSTLVEFVADSAAARR